MTSGSLPRNLAQGEVFDEKTLENEGHQKFRDQGPRRILEYDCLRAVQCRALILVSGVLDLRYRHKVSMREEGKKEKTGEGSGKFIVVGLAG